MWQQRLLKTSWRPKVLVVEHNGRQIEVMAEAEKHKYAAIHWNQENMVLCRK
jgi:hypothetical protein